MNNTELLTKLLSGLSKTLSIANKVIPIYQDTKPLFKNMKNIYSLFKGNESNTSNNTITAKSDNTLSLPKPKIIKKENLPKSSDNSPQFFM